MNVERMTELAGFLHTVPKDDGCNVHPFAFNLGVYGAPLNKRAAVIAPCNEGVYPTCGTIGCIAGAACYLFGGPGLSHPRNWGPDAAAKLLDLTDTQAAELFTPSIGPDYGDPEELACYPAVKPEAAAGVVRWMADNPDRAEDADLILDEWRERVAA